MSDNAELLVAIGRIEEGMRYMRESMERVERKLGSHDDRLTDVEHDVIELKTQRKSKANGLTIFFAAMALVASIASIAVQFR